MIEKTYLYRHFDKHGILLYVGIAFNPLLRLNRHEDESAWYSKITFVKIEPFNNRKDAMNAERFAIKNESPLYNKTHMPKLEKEDRYESMGRYNLTLTADITEWVENGAAELGIKPIDFIRMKLFDSMKKALNPPLAKGE